MSNDINQKILAQRDILLGLLGEVLALGKTEVKDLLGTEWHENCTSAVKEILAEDKLQPELIVVLVSFPETNGKKNWTAQFRRADKTWKGLPGNCGGITFSAGEYWNRVAYDFERARYLLGQRELEPSIIDFAKDITSPDEFEGEIIGNQRLAVMKSIEANNGVLHDKK